MRHSGFSSPDVREANFRPTRILDYPSHQVQAVVGRMKTANIAPRDYLQAAYRLIREEVRPVYTVDELQPSSVTFSKVKGSCSQRFACLESMARANGIGTRVRGLWISGRFWNPRFKITNGFIPERILLAWPQFYLDSKWVEVDELFVSPTSLAQRNPRAFANDGESLFDSIDHTAVDFFGKTAGCSSGVCDLSRFMIGEAGVFDSRDDLFAESSSFQRTLRGRIFELFYGGRKSN